MDKKSGVSARLPTSRPPTELCQSHHINPYPNAPMVMPAAAARLAADATTMLRHSRHAAAIEAAMQRNAKQGQLVNAVLSGCGYKEIRFRGCRLYAHRVVFALHYGRWPTPRCDHIDGNKTNNRADNLRECSASENGHNGKMHRDNATGVKGVFRYVRSGYGTEVMSNGVRHRKWFRRLEDAAAHVKQLREQLHGDFARHE